MVGPMSFIFRKKEAQFRSKLLTPLDILPLGLFLGSVKYVIDKKHVNSVGFVSHSFPFPWQRIWVPVLQLEEFSQLVYNL